MIDCHTILEGAVGQGNADIVAGCIEAGAARYAGGLAFDAGAFALFSATIGAVAVYWAAQVQVRLSREQHKARVEAYRWHMRTVIDTLINDLAIANNAIVMLVNGAATLPKSIAIPPDLSSSEWENHALLGSAAVSKLARSAATLHDFNAKLAPVTLDNLRSEHPAGILVDLGTHQGSTCFDVVASFPTTLQMTLRELVQAMNEPSALGRKARSAEPKVRDH